MKPSAVILETAEVRAARLKRKHATDNLLRNAEREGARFGSATAMVGWFFGIRDHVASVAAMDPSADVIQGSRVDRDERHYWVGSVEQCLRRLVVAQGNSVGILLLWLHLRPRIVQGYKVKRGIRMPVALDPVPLWDLHAHPAVRLSQRGAIRAYREALAWVEEYGWERGWLTNRAKREARKENSYRREG